MKITNGHRLATSAANAASASTPETARPLWVEIAPGQRIVKLSNEEKGRILISDLLPTGGGTYQAVARVHSRWAGMGVADLKKFGIEVSRQTLRRLMFAGFIRYSQPAPNRYQFDLESYFAHERATQDDPEFWTRDNGRNRKRYLEAWAGTGFDRQDARNGASGVGTPPECATAAKRPLKLSARLGERHS